MSGKRNPENWFADRSIWLENRSYIWSDRRIEMSGTAVSHVSELMDMKKGECILDLACGFGRHTFEFSNLGLRATGVDLNQDFIVEAGSKATEESGLLSFIQADMRDYVEPESFNHIVLLYNSFGYFEDPGDDRIVISNCFDSLLPGGKLLISVTGKELNKHNMPSGSFRNWTENDGIVRLEECTFDDTSNWLSTRWIVIEGADRKAYEYGCRLYSREELTQLLASRGFENIQVFGGLRGTPYDDRASSLVVVAQKPGEQ